MPALLFALLAQAPKWATYVAKADGFSVLMPAAPRIVPQSAEGVTTRIYLGITPKGTMIASKSVLPPGFGKANVDAMTKAMRQSILTSSGATATGGHKATFAGIAGTQTDFKMPNGGTGATWIGSTPRALYSLSTVMPTPMKPAEIARLFGTFKVK